MITLIKTTQKRENPILKNSINKPKNKWRKCHLALF